MRAPAFWWQGPGALSLALSPLAAAYGHVAGRRLETAPRVPLPVPVICVGNPTVGGAGKTPLALALGQAARARGLNPAYLTRGYGSRARSPVLVDPQASAARDVGDEPLLLSRVGPTVVCPDRARGAEHLLSAVRADLVIMDDGFQSAQIHPDLAVLVVDGKRGFGNGRVLPAGPLRAPLVSQLRRADVLVVVGEGEGAGAAARASARAGRTMLRAHLASVRPERFSGARVLAFAGIGDPEKFYATLRAAGAHIVATRDFPDHHRLTEAEMAALIKEAMSADLKLVTTSKDAARLSGESGLAASLRSCLDVLDVELRFAEEDQPERLIEMAFSAFERRRFSPGSGRSTSAG
ncbi:tetraacyldisaccharide 4'-kinase [Consotaella salsifontis]|uniref:Tetraacyldisaccharide 4'-kinase n=1 Tax=Consotaella salsifontis TaxID=1365950 RepID=A0A1T4PYJ2_9HYPH|nr:tetraacyldisaccharide 4'-kinase [Consotaella salsifontis]SJZ96396.1 lipid-A-disaccharide kinase [Consotaella salsifontis]